MSLKTLFKTLEKLKSINLKFLKNKTKFLKIADLQTLLHLRVNEIFNCVCENKNKFSIIKLGI